MPQIAISARHISKMVIFGEWTPKVEFGSEIDLRHAFDNHMQTSIQTYHLDLAHEDRVLCEALYEVIVRTLPEAEGKIWHAHPVWFLAGNPVVGYHRLKSAVRLLFWSGQSFEEPMLKNEGKFKAAEYRFTSAEELTDLPLERWLTKSREIQWDYKNIVKRRGELLRLK